MQGPLDQQRAMMAQREAMRHPGFAAGGGLQQPAGAASSPMGPGQHPSPAAGPSPGFPEALGQVEQVLMQGNEADLALFGEFIGRLQMLVQEHQGGAQPGGGAPAPGAGPMMG